MIDGSGKRNGWLNVELQSADVIERCSKKFNRKFLFVCAFFCFCLFVCFLGGGGFKHRLNRSSPPVPLFFHEILETGKLRWSCRHLGLYRRVRSGESV